jgi:hypothetical protein
MQRNPLAFISVLAAFYIYFFVRGLGRGLAATAMGMVVRPVMRYRVLPGFDVLPGASDIAPRRLAVLILASPVLALLVGYTLLGVMSVRGSRFSYNVRLFICVGSYLGLILDPIYYAVIPLLRLGGEPEMLAQALDAPALAIAFPAMALLGLNVLLARKRLVPILKGQAGC